MRDVATELIDDPLTYVPDSAAAPARETGLSVAEPQPPALMEFRAGFMSMPVKRMKIAQKEYLTRRKAFREWILSNLVEGIHFGFSPGCEPNFCDVHGKSVPEEAATHIRSWNGKQNKWNVVPFASWTPKPSLYAAGADFICDLLWVRDEYMADMETWQQAGSVPGKLIRKCKLYSRLNREFLGEGTGARIDGQKGGDLNNAVKMADKSAKVAAVLNTWGLRDLFTQDLENEPQPPHPSSPGDPNAPRAQPRADRLTKDSIDGLGLRWKKSQHPDHCKMADWTAFVEQATGRQFGTDQNGVSNVARWLSWTPKDVELVIVALAERDA